MYLNTARIPWTSLRGAVAADDTTQASLGFDFGDWPSTGVLSLSKAPLADANGLAIAFHGTDAADETANYKLYGRARNNGPIQLLLEGVVTLGSQVCTTDPIDNSTAISGGLWADTISITGGIFNDSDIYTILDSGNNRICIVKFDQQWIEDFRLEIDIPASGQVASIYGIITGY